MKNILVIGCGGNGSHFINYLLKDGDIVDFLRDKNIYLIDPDIVESKNLERQDFSKGDIREYKAIALAQRLLNKQIENIHVCISSQPLIDIIPHYVFVLVDNMPARRYYYENIFKKYKDKLILYVDAGNEQYHGQTFFITQNSSQVLLNTYETFLKTLDPLETAPCSQNLQSLYINKIIAYSIYLNFKNLIEEKNIDHFLIINPEKDNITRKKLILYNINCLEGFIINDKNDLELLERENFMSYIYIDENKNYGVIFNSYVAKKQIKLIIMNNKIPDIYYNNGIYYVNIQEEKFPKKYLINNNKERILNKIINDLKDKDLLKKFSIGFAYNDFEYIKLKLKLFLSQMFEKDT